MKPLIMELVTDLYKVVEQPEVTYACSVLLCDAHGQQVLTRC